MTGVLACVLAVVGVTFGATPMANADEWRNKQWHLDFLNAKEVHTITKGKGVTVAVVDTGVDGKHPDLKGNVIKGQDFLDAGDGWRDTDGHGTAMASLIAGHGHGPEGANGVLGLAPLATILPVRINGDDADEYDAADVRNGLNWAAANGAKVINCSFRGGVERAAVENALESDAVVVAAAGNASQGDFGVGWPARNPGVIAVSGLDSNGSFTDISVEGPEVVLSAPAVEIAAAGAGERGRYATGTGTSDAAALVSATAALIRARYPDLSANGVINRLIKTADDKGPPGRDSQYGFGVVNPLKALTADIPDIDYNPLIKGTPAPTSSSKADAAGGRAADGGGGYLLPVLMVLGGVVAFAFLLSGAYLVSRNRSTTRATTAPAPLAATWQPQSDQRHLPPQAGPGGPA